MQHHLSPLLLKTLSERSAFPLTLRGTRVVFLLLKQFSAELATEAEVFLTLLIKLVSGETEGGESRPSWMRVLAMEIMRGCVSFSLVSCTGLISDRTTRAQALRRRRVYA